MPRIKFTEEPKIPRDMAHLGYRKGLEFNVTDQEANRWLGKGCAEIVPNEKPADEKKKEEVVPTKEPEIKVESKTEDKKSEPEPAVPGGQSTVQGAGAPPPNVSVPPLVKK